MNCYEKWCNLKYQGSGVIHFQTYTASNDFIYNKNSLSSSEWTAAIKLNTNYANLNGVPGNVTSSALCRKCNRETESIAHVTGSCPTNTQDSANHRKTPQNQTSTETIVRRKRFEMLRRGTCNRFGWTIKIQ